MAAAVAVVPIVSGCGSSGPSDKDQIAAIIKNEGTNPASLCAHLVDALLVRFGGISACQRQAASAAKDSTTRATSVIVHDKGATALVTDRAGTRTLSLVKQNGVWKISAVK
jgi:hypothetical protein